MCAIIKILNQHGVELQIVVTSSWTRNVTFYPMCYGLEAVCGLKTSSFIRKVGNDESIPASLIDRDCYCPKRAKRSTDRLIDRSTNLQID